MNSRHLHLQNGFIGLLIGVVLALYISLTTFWLMSYDAWLTLHNSLIVVSIVLAAVIGYRYRGFGLSLRSLLVSAVIYFGVFMILYIGSYTVTTAFFAKEMVWIPYFYRDYAYHGFRSVSDYLNHENNFVALLQLQVFSMAVGSIMYFAAAMLGYGARAVVDGMRKSASMTTLSI